MVKPLDGLLVVSLEQAVAAPYASSRLADAGARVIKIEREEGDFARRYDTLVRGESAYFVWLNRGKQSLVLNVKQADDLALLKRLLKKADVFIQNLAPGAVERLGLTSDRLREENPRLITCWMSGYGDTGALKDLKAYDLLVQAESGLAEITGAGDHRARVGVSIADISCGMNAHAGILQALITRGLTGKGSHLAVSLYHSLADQMNVPYLQYAYGGVTPARNGLSHPTIAPYGAFETKTGALLFSIQNEREWVALCVAIGLDNKPAYASNVLRVENREMLDLEISAIFSTHTRDEMSAILESAGIAYGRVSTLEDVKNHPQNRLMDVETAAGMVQIQAPAVIFNGEAQIVAKVPEIGEHTATIREEF
jgi:crotonobetainyl-CoA:carnitine CoA-transferase CaiB-like acyl-CoA transferase